MRHAMMTLAIIFTCATALAAPPGSNDTDFVEPAEPDEVLLTDGNFLVGVVIEERADVVVFETESLGRLKIPRANIVRLARGGDRAGAMIDPDYNSLMFCPTPATLARGDSYFRNFELFFLNFGTGITDAFDLSFGTLFPISSEVIMLSLGGKLRLVGREEQALGLALVGSYTRLEEIQFGAMGAVAGIGDRRNSLNLTVNRTFDDDGNTETVFILGADA